MHNWTLTWDDVTFGPDDLTAGDLALVDGTTGCGWAGLIGLPSPRVAADLIASVVARRTGRSFPEVAAEVAATPAERLVAALSLSEQ